MRGLPIDPIPRGLTPSTARLLLHVALGAASALVTVLCITAGVLLLIMPGPAYYDYDERKVRRMDAVHRIWRTALPALVCAVPNAALVAHSGHVVAATVRRDWDASALRARRGVGVLLGAGALSAALGLALLTSLLTNAQTSIDPAEVVPFVVLYASPIALAALAAVVAMAPELEPTHERAGPWSQTLLEIAANGVGVAGGLAGGARVAAGGVARGVTVREAVVAHLDFDHTAAGALRAFDLCHRIAFGSAGACFAAYALYAAGTAAAPAVLVVGDAGNVVAGWIWGEQHLESAAIVRAIDAVKHMLHDSQRTTALLATGAVTAYCRRFFREKRRARAADPALLRAKHNVPLLVALSVALHGLKGVHWPMPWVVGKVLEIACMASLCFAAVIELVLVFRSEAQDRWSRNVFTLVESKVMLDEDDQTLESRHEEEKVCGLDEKDALVSGGKVAVALGGDAAAPLLDLAAPQVELPAMPTKAVLSETRTNDSRRR